MSNYMKEVLDKMVEIRKACPSGHIYILEEFAEAQKEIMKRERGNGELKLVIEELCDVLCTIFVQFHFLGVDPEMVRNQMLYKLNRAIKRWETGQRGANEPRDPS